MRSAYVLVCILAPVVAGCYYYRAEPTPRPGPAFVRVRLDPPQSLDLSTTTGGMVALADVTRLDGQVLKVRGDTITLHVRRAYSHEGWLRARAARSSVATITIGPGRVLERRRLDKAATVAAGIGIPLVTMLTVLSLAIPHT